MAAANPKANPSPKGRLPYESRLPPSWSISSASTASLPAFSDSTFCPKSQPLQKHINLTVPRRKPPPNLHGRAYSSSSIEINIQTPTGTSQPISPPESPLEPPHPDFAMPLRSSRSDTNMRRKAVSIERKPVPSPSPPSGATTPKAQPQKAESTKSSSIKSSTSSNTHTPRSSYSGVGGASLNCPRTPPTIPSASSSANIEGQESTRPRYCRAKTTSDATATITSGSWSPGPPRLNTKFATQLGQQPIDEDQGATSFFSPISSDDEGDDDDDRSGRSKLRSTSALGFARRTMFGGSENGPDGGDSRPSSRRPLGIKKRGISGPQVKETKGDRSQNRVSSFAGAQFRRFLGREQPADNNRSEGPGSRSTSPAPREGLFARRRAQTSAAAAEPSVPLLKDLIKQEEANQACSSSTGAAQPLKCLTISAPIPHPDLRDLMHVPPAATTTTSSTPTTPEHNPSPRYPSMDSSSFASSTIPPYALISDSPRSSCSNDEDADDDCYCNDARAPFPALMPPQFQLPSKQRAAPSAPPPQSQPASRTSLPLTPPASATLSQQGQDDPYEWLRSSLATIEHRYHCDAAAVAASPPHERDSATGGFIEALETRIAAEQLLLQTLRTAAARRSCGSAALSASESESGASSSLLMMQGGRASEDGAPVGLGLGLPQSQVNRKRATSDVSVASNRSVGQPPQSLAPMMMAPTWAPAGAPATVATTVPRKARGTFGEQQFRAAVGIRRPSHARGLSEGGESVVRVIEGVPLTQI